MSFDTRSDYTADKAKENPNETKLNLTSSPTPFALITSCVDQPDGSGTVYLERTASEHDPVQTHQRQKHRRLEERRSESLAMRDKALRRLKTVKDRVSEEVNSAQIVAGMNAEVSKAEAYSEGAPDAETRAVLKIETRQLLSETTIIPNEPKGYHALSCQPDDNRRIVGTGGVDDLHAESEDDCLVGLKGADYLFVSDHAKGSTSLAGPGQDDVVIGWNAEHTLSAGGRGDDFIWGGDKEDVIYGGKGWDCIYGEGGNDYIRSGPGDDYVDGFVGDDEIEGGGGDDLLIGGAGSDNIVGEEATI